MKKTLAISLAITLITGCSTKSPMPDNLYFKQASLLMHMDRCKQAGYLNSYDYNAGFYAMTYIVNTWNFDEKAFKDELYESSLPWKNIVATSTWCEGTKNKVDSLIANANNHKKSSAKRRVENQQTMAILAQSLQTITQAASNSVQKMQVNSYNPSGANPNNKSNILYDSSRCTGSVVNGACTGIVLPNTPKYKCHGTVLHDGTCSGRVQRVY